MINSNSWMAQFSLPDNAPTPTAAPLNTLTFNVFGRPEYSRLDSNTISLSTNQPEEAPSDDTDEALRNMTAEDMQEQFKKTWDEEDADLDPEVQGFLQD